MNFYKSILFACNQQTPPAGKELKTKNKTGIVLILKEKYYGNMPMQYTAIFHGCINDNFQIKKCIIFLSFGLKHRSWAHVRTVSLRRF